MDGPVNLLSLGKLTKRQRDYIWMRLTDCLLSDGGGIRGVSELAILHEIMKRIQFDKALPELPRPCDYFHIIGGTSTGG